MIFVLVEMILDDIRPTIQYAKLKSSHLSDELKKVNLDYDANHAVTFLFWYPKNPEHDLLTMLHPLQ